MKLLTVFTPTYDRANLLPRLYESLKSQTDKNFIWMIIDDGSSDKTKEIVQQWIDDKELEIQYYWKENGGMHSAHNLAYEKITTEWNTCIDSDDKMPENAVEIINRVIIEDTTPECYGYVGLDADYNGIILGKEIPANFEKVKMTELESLHGINGDKKLIYKTSIIKKLPPYPVFETEKLVPLSYKSLEAESRGFYLKPINEILCLVEYQDSGSTKNMFRQYRKNPKGFNFMRIAKLNSNIHFKEKIKSAIHLVSGSMFSNEISNIFKTKETALVLSMIPFGLLLNLYIRYKTINQY